MEPFSEVINMNSTCVSLKPLDVIHPLDPDEEIYHNQEAQVWPSIIVTQVEQTQLVDASIVGQIMMNDESDTIIQDSLTHLKNLRLFPTLKYDSEPDDPNLFPTHEPVKHK